MRLSAELLGLCEQRTNPLGEREIVLRGLAIPSIEHLAVTRDAYDTMDFTDNRLGRIDNFPRLSRLSALKMAGNVVSSIDHGNLEKNVPNLAYLDLSNNKIASLAEVANLGGACPKLEFLSLYSNPVTRRQHYRLYTIKSIPTLKVLDFAKVTQKERDRADRLANSAAGAALEVDVQEEAQNAKTFVPGEGKSAEESFVRSFSPEEKEAIRRLVAEASSPAEIEEIEKSVRRGILPKGINANGNGKKRPSDKNGDDGPQAAKKIRA